MLTVAIVGDHASGKATFLGLVYATLVSSGAGREDELRFAVGYDSIEEISGLFERMMSGGFPDTAAKEGIHGLKLELETAGLGRGVFSRFGGRKRANGDTQTVQLSLPGSLDETNPGLAHGSTFGTGRWRDALDADVVAIVADSTKLGPKAVDPKASPLADFDGRVRSMLVSVLRWRTGGGRPVLHPVFILTKFDAVRPEILNAANLEPAPPDTGKTGARLAYAKAILEPNLPRTFALLAEPSGKKLRFDPPGVVFSSVRTDASTASEPLKIKRRRSPNGGWELDYGREEYVAFLRWLAGVAAGVGG